MKHFLLKNFPRFLLRDLRITTLLKCAVSSCLALGLSATFVSVLAQPSIKPLQSAAAQWDDRSVYAFLAAELLSLDEDFEQAALALWPVARQVKQAELYERVTQWAARAKRYDILYLAATAWETNDPVAQQPKTIISFLLVPLRLERMEALRLAGKPDEAREQLLSAYAARNRVDSAETALLLAEQLEEDYQFPQALDLYAAAIKLGANKEQADLSRARILAIKAKGGDAASLAALVAAQQTSTGATKRLFNAVTVAVLRDAEQYEQALKLIQSLPLDEQAYETALTYDMMGQADKAEVLLREALKKSPKAPHLLNTLGYSLVDRNPNLAALAEGTALLEAAYKAAPNSNAIMDSLGWAYFRNKDYAKAQTLLQKSYDLKRDPEVAAHLGELLHTTGKTDQARKLWAQALALEPKHKVLNSTLKRLGIVGIAP
jgi:tetratricopeptide (TPR) repeat protein